jgi:hypothetical protein
MMREKPDKRRLMFVIPEMILIALLVIAALAYLILA